MAAADAASFLTLLLSAQRVLLPLWDRKMQIFSFRYAKMAFVTLLRILRVPWEQHSRSQFRARAHTHTHTA
eukprot:12447-Rhodomonas_salina.3